MNVSTTNALAFGSGGTLVLDHGAGVGALQDFDLGNGDSAINFADVTYPQGETATLTQNGDTARFQVGGYSAAVTSRRRRRRCWERAPAAATLST